MSRPAKIHTVGDLIDELMRFDRDEKIRVKEGMTLHGVDAVREISGRITIISKPEARMPTRRPRQPRLSRPSYE